MGKTLEGFLPVRGVLRIVGLQREGFADHGAQFGERGQVAERDGLDQRVADGGRFHRSGQHLAARRARRELVEQTALAAAADDVQPPDRAPGEFLDLASVRW